MIPSRLRTMSTAIAAVAGFIAVQSYSAVTASPLGMTRSAADAYDSMIGQVAAHGGMRARSANVSRGRSVNRSAARSRNVNVGRARNVTRTRDVNVNRTVVRRGAWVRPGYRWRPGGAIAAGAAIGFVAAATAAAWAGPPPGPGLCWYYTDPTRTQGFWDVCP